jgi:hypothetical protein
MYLNKIDLIKIKESILFPQVAPLLILFPYSNVYNRLPSKDTNFCCKWDSTFSIFTKTKHLIRSVLNLSSKNQCGKGNLNLKTPFLDILKTNLML